MRRRVRFAIYMGFGALAGLLVAAVIIFSVTRTDWGMERARVYALGWLKDRVHGTVTVDRITGTGLLTGAVLHNVSIVDERGRPFLEVDSVAASYSWRTLVTGQIVLNRAVLYRPRVHLEQLPGDTAWNYEYIFQDTTPRDTLRPSERTLVMFRNARVVNGSAWVLTPVDSDARIEPADTARVILERMPTGLAKVMRFENIAAELGRIIWEQPQHEGKLFEIVSASGTGFVFREPLTLRNARGRVAMRDSTVTLDFQRVDLPASHAAIFGNVIHTRGQNYYDLQIDADRFAFADIGWIYPQLPEQGGGSARIRIQSQRALNSTLWLAENARIRTEGTNLSGSFGVVLGDTMYFTRVDLRASPLDVALLERLLPGGLPVEGLLVGTVEVKGPLSALETEGDLKLARNGTSSAVKWAGVVDARRGRRGARALRADFASFDLALLRAFRPALALEGAVTGRVNASGRLASSLSFDADLEHHRDGGESSRVTGKGVLAAAGRDRTLELEVEAQPFALSELAHRYPALRGLEGHATGPVRLRGALHDLEVDAALQTRAGPIHFTGRLARGRDGPRYAGEARLSSFRLHEFLDRLPHATLSGAVAFDLTGASLAETRGNLRIQLDSADVARVSLQRSWMEARLADGLLYVDTLHAATLAGDLTGRGSLGIVPERSGTLALDLRSASVGILEADIFGAQASPDAEAPRLAGSVRAHGELAGTLTNLAASAEGDVRSLVLGPLRLAHGRATLLASGLGSAQPLLAVEALADSAAAYGHVLDAVRLELGHELGVSRFRLNGGPPGADKLAAAGAVTRSADTTVVSLHELLLGESDSWRLADSVRVRIDPHTLQLSSALLRRGAGAGTLSAGGTLAWAADSGADTPLDFRLAADGVPFTDFLRATRSRAVGGGRLDGELRIGGSALAPLMEGHVTATQLAYNEVRMERSFAELTYANEGAELFLEAQHGPKRVFYGGGTIPLDLRFTTLAERRLERPLNLTLTADSLPAGQVLPFLPGFHGVQGWLNGTLQATGTTLDPALGGELRAEHIDASWSVSGVRYTDFNGSFRLVSDRAVDVRATARTALPRRGFAAAEYGSGTVTGTLDFARLSDPAFDLRLDADRVLAADRRDVDAVVSGELQLGGRYTQPVVTGALRVDRGTLYLDEVYRQFFVVQLDSARVYQFVDTSLVSRRRVLPISKNPFLEGLVVRNAQVSVGNESWLRGADLDVEVEGELNVLYDRRADDLRMTGTLDVVRGTYQLAYPPLQARRFNVRQGTIEFPGLPGIDPNLAIEAVYKGRAETEPLDIVAQVTGSLQAPRVRLTSDEEPPISESDLASYLFFGVPTWKVGTIMGTQNADTRDALAGLGFNTFTPSLFGYASSGLQTLAQSVGLLDYVSLTAAEFAPGTDPGNRTDALRNYQLDMGRYLTPNLYLGVSQRLAAGSSQPAARLEWRFHPTFTLELFAEDRFARNGPTFGYNQEAVLKRVYGFFLFREWGY